MRYFLATAAAFLFSVHTGNAAGLRLVRTIPLSGVNGRIDHFAIDLAGQRLFVCALGNNSVEVLDLRAGARVKSITGLGAPQGVACTADGGRIFVANDNGGLCNIYDGRTYAQTGTIDYKDDADNMRYDAAAKRVYAGYGNGALGIIDAVTGKKLGDMELPGHPEAFQLEKNGTRIFVNVPDAHEVAVLDRAKGRVVATWRLGLSLANFPMALDEGNHRLFIGCRVPATLLVLDTTNGREVAAEGIDDAVDDVFYDVANKLIYAICGQGCISIIQQVDPNHYRTVKKIPTAAGARTGLFVPELGSLFVAVPHRGAQQAEVREYKVE